MKQKGNWMTFLLRKHPKEEIQPGQLPYLILGLGNPGVEYRTSRHNVGFMVIDKLASEFCVKLSKYQFKALVGTHTLDGKKIILAKPQTFMNLSGVVVGSLLRFYKIPTQNLMIIHDDVDLPLGTLRIRPKGGSAGQKGLGSIIERLGSKDFPRLRVGISRPPGQKATASYVLENFLKPEQEMLDALLRQATDAVKEFVCSGLDAAMNHYNGDQFKE